MRCESIHTHDLWKKKNIIISNTAFSTNYGLIEKLLKILWFQQLLFSRLVSRMYTRTIKKKRVLSSNTGHFKSEFLEKNNSRSVQYLGCTWEAPPSKVQSKTNCFSRERLALSTSSGSSIGSIRTHIYKGWQNWMKAIDKQYKTSLQWVFSYITKIFIMVDIFMSQKKSIITYRYLPTITKFTIPGAVISTPRNWITVIISDNSLP